MYIIAIYSIERIVKKLSFIAIFRFC